MVMAAPDTVHPEHTGSMPSMAAPDTVHPEHKKAINIIFMASCDSRIDV
jgi:hypothetical protein